MIYSLYRPEKTLQLNKKLNKFYNSFLVLLLFSGDTILQILLLPFCLEVHFLLLKRHNSPPPLSTISLPCVLNYLDSDCNS